MRRKLDIPPAQAEQDFLKTMRPTTLIRRFATTEEVANMVVYVTSEQASAATGAALRVDGGALRSMLDVINIGSVEKNPGDELLRWSDVNGATPLT